MCITHAQSHKENKEREKGCGHVGGREQIAMAMYKPIKGQEEGSGNRDKSLKSNDEGVHVDDDEVVDENKSFILPTHSRQQHDVQRQKQQRLVSLDVFRGLTVASSLANGGQLACAVYCMIQLEPFLNAKLMILVDDAGGVLPAINHSPWNGLTLADVVMPFFLFIVGVSLGLTYKSLLAGYSGKHTFMWFLNIYYLSFPGGFLHGLNDLTYGVDMTQIRCMGILQRIAIGYLVGAMCEIWLKGGSHATSGLSMLRKYQFQWAAVLMLVTIYLSLLYGLHVPDWEYQIPVAASSSTPKIFPVKCGVRGDTGPACNADGMIDRTILGIQHLYRKPIYARTKILIIVNFLPQPCSINSPGYGPLPPDAPSWCQAPFDPEGLLSSVMAIVTCLVGLHYGHIIVHFKEHKDRTLHWMVPSTCFLVLGLVLDLLGMHVNKALYTFSYMCVTAGAAGIVFTGIYLLVDVCGFRWPMLVLEWMGMHALLIFILATSNVLPVVLQGFYWKQPGNNIVIIPFLCLGSLELEDERIAD
ncbi:hypothetical protein NC653_000841 [Populus alba x Populus x berolinensis]|uniref:Heparan-alpha-glucosaminide N-acetyltransferase catalytic domain-containing protein n=1 Tax=Populus alba x Populus x berolinensis TaxID=444605 RepID=A0AAD6RKP1_9ROSI|nr:hypothetical protein NC653_000841 [Populus alba x Populus x berolinensis]